MPRSRSIATSRRSDPAPTAVRTLCRVRRSRPFAGYLVGANPASFAGNFPVRCTLGLRFPIGIHLRTGGDQSVEVAPLPAQLIAPVAHVRSMPNRVRLTRINAQRLRHFLQLVARGANVEIGNRRNIGRSPSSTRPQTDCQYSACSLTAACSLNGTCSETRGKNMGFVGATPIPGRCTPLATHPRTKRNRSALYVVWIGAMED